MGMVKSSHPSNAVLFLSGFPENQPTNGAPQETTHTHMGLSFSGGDSIFDGFFRDPKVEPPFSGAVPPTKYPPSFRGQRKTGLCWGAFFPCKKTTPPPPPHPSDFPGRLAHPIAPRLASPLVRASGPRLRSAPSRAARVASGRRWACGSWGRR